jgi:peptide/nickel transport system permease protein
VHVGVSETRDPLADLYLCLPQCQDGFDALTAQYNLDQSIWLRPFTWFWHAIQGDFGQSETIGGDVSTILWERGKNTAMIAIPAFILGSIIALFLSVFSAKNQYSKGDYFFTGLSFLGFAFPSFVMALLLQHIFGVRFEEWFGVKPFNTGRKTGENVLTLARDVTLPVTSLMILGIASDSRFGRSSMLETLNQDYIRTARAKGLSERTVVWKHGLRNALIPLVTLWALNLSALLGGSIVTESIFSWPGLGTAFLPALNKPDLDLLLGIVMLTGVIVVVFNLLADVLYGILDPRIRFD